MTASQFPPPTAPPIIVSGFVIDDDGHIITNYDVVRDADDLEIAFSSGYKVRGEVLGTDEGGEIRAHFICTPT